MQRAIRCLHLAEVVEEVEISDGQFFRQMPTSSKTVTMFRVHTVQGFTQRKMTLMAAPQPEAEV